MPPVAGDPVESGLLESKPVAVEGNPPEIEVGVSRETVERLEILVRLLKQWNPTVNLVSPDSMSDAWQRHVLDSLRLLPFILDAKRPVDLGSGAGFPGLVLAIATAIEYTLVESDQRKASFLREAVRLTKAPVTLHVGRVEGLGAFEFDLITARGFAPLPRLLAASRHLLAPEGRYLLLKGPTIHEELSAARELFAFTAAIMPEPRPQPGCIVAISGVVEHRA